MDINEQDLIELTLLTAKATLEGKRTTDLSVDTLKRLIDIAQEYTDRDAECEECENTQYELNNAQSERDELQSILETLDWQKDEIGRKIHVVATRLESLADELKETEVLSELAKKIQEHADEVSNLHTEVLQLASSY